MCSLLDTINSVPEELRFLSFLVPILHIGSGAVPALIEALKNQDEDVRLAAADTLLELGPAAKGAAPALKKALDDEDDDVRRQAPKH